MFDLAQIAFDRDAAGKQSLVASWFEIIVWSEPEAELAGRIVDSRFAVVLSGRHTKPKYNKRRRDG
jgi:hypothetical protein